MGIYHQNQNPKPKTQNPKPKTKIKKQTPNSIHPYDSLIPCHVLSTPSIKIENC
jgi:hypothetical protein